MSRLQQAFHEKLGTQCGFCTPGMIIAAEALLRRNPHPSRDEIKAALAGNLCRCTGYVKIIESVEAAAASGGGAMSIRAPGKSPCRLGGRAHAADRRRREGHRQSQIHRRSAGAGALCGRMLRSPLPHARIVSIDTSEAEALEGVVAVCTGADCKVPFGVLPIAENEFPLAREKVRYRGDPVAAVAAVDEATAAKALKLIRVEYEKLPAYFDARKAMAPGADADPRRKAQQRPARGPQRVRRCRGGVSSGRSCARENLPLRRSQPRPYRAQCDAGRIRSRARPSDAAHDHAGAVLRPAQSRALPGDGRSACPGGQALRGRRLRRADGVPAFRDHRRLAGPQGWRHRAAAADARRNLHRASRPAGNQDHPQARHDQGRQADRLPHAGRRSAAAPMPATASSPSSTPARCCTASTTSRPSSTMAGASTPTPRPAALSAATARSMRARPSRR